MKFQTAPELEGWTAQEDEHGFFVYTRPDFKGCIRLNPVGGTAEVFMNKSPLENPHAEPIYREVGYISAIVEPSTEPLERAQLCAEGIIGFELLTGEESLSKID